MIKLVCEACANEWYIEESKKKLLRGCPFCFSPLPEEEEITVDSFESALLNTAHDLGMECLKDRQRFIGYLLDIAPKYKKEIRIFSNACSADVFLTLHGARKQTREEAAPVFARVQLRMTDDEGIAEQWAQLICTALLNATHPKKKPAASTTTSIVPSTSGGTSTSTVPSTSGGTTSPITTAIPSSNSSDFVIKGNVLTKYTGTAETVVIPEGITTIAYRAFHKNNRIKKVKLPAPLSSIEMEAFSYCSQLSLIAFNNNLWHIGIKAFSECISLKKLLLPDSIQVLGVEAFSNCIALSEVRLPRKLPYLRDKVFAGCTKIKTVTVPKGTTTIADNAFPATTRIIRE